MAKKPYEYTPEENRLGIRSFTTKILNKINLPEMNMQTKAIFILAFAMFAQPFISKILDNWGTYGSREEAKDACWRWVRGGRRVLIAGERGWNVRNCKFNKNHVAGTTKPIREYPSKRAFHQASKKVVKRFYF